MIRSKALRHLVLLGLSLMGVLGFGVMVFTALSPSLDCPAVATIKSVQCSDRTAIKVILGIAGVAMLLGAVVLYRRLGRKEQLTVTQ